MQLPSAVGGAAKTEYPFPKAPKLGTSTGAYLLGVMQPELIAKLGPKLQLIRRDPHYFLPTTDRRYLLFGSDADAMRRQFVEFFSEQDWRANEAMNREIGQIRDGEVLVCPVTAPSWGPVFGRIAAAVSDIGGTMSHAAIVAREYGMPAVVGTGQATTRIRTGDRVRVDGDRGIVTILG